MAAFTWEPTFFAGSIGAIIFPTREGVEGGGPGKSYGRKLGSLQKRKKRFFINMDFLLEIAVLTKIREKISKNRKFPFLSARSFLKVPDFRLLGRR